MPGIVQDKEALDYLQRQKYVTYKYDKDSMQAKFTLTITPTKKGYDYTNTLLLPTSKKKTQ